MSPRGWWRVYRARLLRLWGVGIACSLLVTGASPLGTWSSCGPASSISSYMCKANGFLPRSSSWPLMMPPSSPWDDANRCRGRTWPGFSGGWDVSSSQAIAVRVREMWRIDFGRKSGACSPT
jgi:hypothetical protein